MTGQEFDAAALLRGAFERAAWGAWVAATAIFGARDYAGTSVFGVDIHW